MKSHRRRLAGTYPGARAGMFLYLLALITLLATGTTVAATGLHPPHHDIRVVIDTASGDTRISDRLQLSGQPVYRFRLAHWLELEALQLNGEAVKARKSEGLFEVALTNETENILEFEMAGRLPPSHDGSLNTSSHGPDGSFLPAWDSWIPQDYSQPMTFRLQATVPVSQRAIATGRLVDETTDGENQGIVTEQLRPGEAPSLFVGPYRVTERIRDGVRLRTYFHAGLGDFTQAYFDAAGSYIDRYRNEIGDYPYDDFHIISAPLPAGLGFPGATYIDRRIVPLPFMRTRSLAHEVLHNWWGNALTVDYLSGNWAEGLTTYMADYALERDKGDIEARNMRVKWLRDYAALPAQRDQPVREFRSKQHQAAQVIGYNKVAFIFHMLNLEIGQRAFDDGIRRFWRDHRFTTASWDDLRDAFEQASGRDLDWFFEQWLDRSGAPELDLGAYSVSSVDDGYLVRVEVLQSQPGYRFRLPARLTTEAGTEYRVMDVESARTRLEWITPNRPVSIHLDPHNDVFRRLDRLETAPILRDVTLHPETQLRIAGNADGFEQIAKQLAGRLMDTPPQLLERNQARDPLRPLLLVTTSAQLDAQLAAIGIELPGALPPGNYAASAWTARLDNGTPVLVISAESADELQALLRPLPHYRGQSYVLFDNGRAQQRGIWQMDRGPLYLDLRDTM